jgi:hypothetical protein
MRISKISGFIAISITLLLLLVVNVSAETTFFDNPDDAFIMGNFPTTDNGITGGATGGGVCTYNWSCTEWSECINGAQTRTCTNLGSCFDNEGKPIELQSCTVKPTAPENITLPTLPTKTPEETKAPTITLTPSTTTPLGLGVVLIVVIAISIVITAIILKKRKQNKNFQT